LRPARPSAPRRSPFPQVRSTRIARELKAHRLASPFAQEHDFVFCTSAGKPMSWSNVIRRGLHKAVANAKLREPRPRFHDLRHTFASLLIGQGAVVYVSRAMGHADLAVTLRVYSHLWAGREHGEHFRALLDTTLSAAVSTGG
jgi:integrase